MAWIESHQSLRDHPKTRKLASLLGIPRMQAVGHLHALWWWALDYAENGDLSRFDITDIALAADWEDDEELFVRALMDCGHGGHAGFLDEDKWLHDWDLYAGKLVERRRTDRQRKRVARGEQPGRPVDVRGTSDGHDTDVPRTAHVPNPTNQPTNRPERRADVDRLCDVLADLVAANCDGKRPNITQKWRDEARKLLDRDQVPLAEAERVARWATADTFWRSNILSMPKFREKFTQLKLRMLNERSPEPPKVVEV